MLVNNKADTNWFDERAARESLRGFFQSEALFWHMKRVENPGPVEVDLLHVEDDILPKSHRGRSKWEGGAKKLRSSDLGKYCRKPLL